MRQIGVSSIGIFIATAAFFAVFFLCRNLEYPQQITASIFSAVIVLWITEAIPLAVTALLGATLLVLFGVSDEKKVFSAFGEPTILLFIGSFLLAKGLQVSQLDQRLAYWLLRYPWASKTPKRLLFTLAFITCLISLFVSNTAVTAMMLPIGLSLLGALETKGKESRYAIGMMLILTWASSVAVGVIVGTPPNLIAYDHIEKVAGVKITFLQWMQFAMPINIVMLLLAWLVLSALYGKDAPSSAHASNLAEEELRKMGRLSMSERNTLIAFAITLFLWLLPDTSAMILGHEAPFPKWTQKHIPPSVASLIGAMLLFLLPTEGTESNRTLSWKQGATIDWGTILLFAGGIALGTAMHDTGLADTLGKAITKLFGIESIWVLTAMTTALAILMSELASNTSAAAAIVPMSIGLAQGAGFSPIPPALGAAIGASFGFMLPISTPPNAIVYSSGLVPVREMMRSGFFFDVAGWIVTVLSLRLILPLMGLA